MAPSRLSKPGYKILGGIGLVLFIWLGLPAIARRMDFFQLRKVDVRGLRNMRAADIVEQLPIRQGMSLYDPLDTIELAADSIPGIQEASVSRRWPGTLVVTVQEAEAVGLVMKGGKLQLMSDRGRVLKFDPTVAAPDLPVVREADSLVGGFLGRLRLSDPTFFGRVNSAWRNGDDVVVSIDGQRYWFRPDAPAEVIRAVTVVAQDLANKNRKWAELDARFDDQVVVRWEVS